VKLSDFKNVTTKPCEIEFDEKYLEAISKLPKERPHRRTLEIISTVAAAVVIIAAVSMWAIIGRGVRGNNVPAATPAEYAEIELTDEVYIGITNDVINKHDVLCFKEFNEQNPLSVHEILQINRYASNGIKINESYMTGKMLNDYAQKLFGTRPADDFALYGCMIELGDVDFAGAEINRVLTLPRDDGTVAVRVEFTEGVSQRLLEYVGTDIYTPTKFTAYYEDGTELAKDYADVEVYKTLCAELDADKNVESYILYLPEAPTKTDVGYSARVMLLDYAFDDGKPHSILGLAEKFKPHQTAELTLDFKKTENGLELIKEDTSAELTVQRNDYANATAYEYKITGDDALELLAIVGEITNDEQSSCACMPTHTITADGKTYSVMMGDVFCSHYVVGNKLRTFTTDEYQKITKIFENAVVTAQKNLDAQIKLSGDTVKVSGYTNADTLDEGEWPGENPPKKEITIIDEDAEKLIKLIGSKTFAYDMVKSAATVTLEIGEREYGLQISGDKPWIRGGGCYQCNLSPDDEIIKIIKTYLALEGDEVETADAFYKSYDGGKTYKKYITKQKAIEIALAESKVNSQNWVGEFYYDPVFEGLEAPKVVDLLCGCYGGMVWDEKCLMDKGAECKRNWLVYLRPKDYPRKYGSFFVDAKTGEIADVFISAQREDF